MATKIEKFDKPTCKAFSEDLVKVLTAFAAERGLTVSYGGGRFDVSGADFAPKLTFKVAVADVALWNQYCVDANLQSKHFGMSFPTSIGGAVAVVTICGIEPRRGKVVAKTSEGKRYLFPYGAIRKQFGCEYDWEKK